MRVLALQALEEVPSAPTHLLSGARVEALSGEGRVLGSRTVPNVWAGRERLEAIVQDQPQELETLRGLMGETELEAELELEGRARPQDVARVRVVRLEAEGAARVQMAAVGAEARTVAESQDSFLEGARVHKLHDGGDARTRTNFVILSDGYLEQDLPEFLARAEKLKDEILMRPPFSEYRESFNVWAVEVPSPEAGASCDDGTAKMRKNLFGTVFPIACINARFGKKYNDRFVHQWRPGRLKQAARLIDEGRAVPTEIFVLVPSKKRGGSAILWATMTDVMRDEVFTHELGHSFGGLADEYIVQGDPCNVFGIFSPNIDRSRKSGKDVKWAPWIADGTPIPTPDDGPFGEALGLHKGGADCPNYYRPRRTCKMRTNGGAFCEVCAEAVIHRLYDHARPIEGPLKLVEGQAQAKLLNPRLITQWWVDGKAQGEPGPYAPLALPPSSQGKTRVELRAWDTTESVRQDRCHLAAKVQATF